MMSAGCIAPVALIMGVASRGALVPPLWFLQGSGTSLQNYRMTSKSTEEESGVELFSLCGCLGRRQKLKEEGTTKVPQNHAPFWARTSSAMTNA